MGMIITISLSESMVTSALNSPIFTFGCKTAILITEPVFCMFADEWIRSEFHSSMRFTGQDIILWLWWKSIRFI